MKTIKARFPRNRARRYQAYLLETLREYHGYIRRLLFPALERLNPYANTDAWGADLFVIMAGIEAFATRFNDRERVNEEAQRVAESTAVARAAAGFSIASTIALGVSRGERPQFGVRGARTQDKNRGVIEAWAIENVKLVTKMRTDEKEAIAGIVTRGFTQGAGVKSIKQEIIKEFGVTARRAQLIAQNEMGNLAGALEKAEADRIGIETYEWLTANDERVRPSHRVMEGKICRWDDPTVYKDSVDDTVWKSRSSIGGVEKHPSMDIRCRCSSASIIDV
jgi:SPP1 gp7 family putative phage head morphogenesis protein